MECNKDEAIRAKEIAERKMQSKDFPGARKFVLRAQHLYSGLENITQMLLVCDVHCASEKKISNESDWYSILQVEPTADEASIRKQYRKSALLLHPDKNKFPGAEAAFKLVGEAQRVLLDRGKRSIFDMKLKASRIAPATVKLPQQPTQVPAGYAHSSIHNNSRANFAGWNPQERMKQKPTHQGVSSGMPTFWTMCPHCKSRYKYYLDVLQKAVRCHNCPATFTAYAEPTNLNQTTFNQQRAAEKQGATVAEDGCQGNSGVEKPKVPVSSKGTPKPEVRAEKVNGKRKKTESEDSSESIDTESSSGSEEDMEAVVNGDISSGQNIGSNANQNVRRSVRHKQQVSYKENLSDDEDLTSHPKKAKGSRSSSTEEKVVDDTLKEESREIKNQSAQTKGADFANFMPCNGKDTEKKIGSETDGGINPKISRTCSGTEKNVSETDEVSSDSSLESAEDAEDRVQQYMCPEPEFNDFEKDHKEGCFSVGQIWALYDDVDAMPRFYGRIKRVFSPGFKVQITWLEPENEREDDALPVSSGNFKAGDTEMIDSHLMFSHLVSWEKGRGRNVWRIFPREGEIWALFKNWDIKLEPNMKTDLKFEYEFVEVLSNYSEDAAIRVAYLAKVKGFISVFCRSLKDGMDEVQIAPHQLFRFSHQVPSYKLTGEERKGVPRGSFELDPASLPANLIEADARRRDVKAEAVVGNMSNPDLVSSSKPKESNECIPENKDGKEEDAEEDKSNSPIPIPEAEFYDFDADKSPEKFKVGQIWAMYSDEDALPKYYVEVKNVEIEPAFKLHIRWLSVNFNPSIQQWQDEDMPSSCGRFKVKGRRQVYDSTAVFSHLMKAEGTDKKDEYDIFPQSGEVWALYRNWNTGIKCCELESCEYEIVEVLNRNDQCTKVILLERVNDFGSVFKRQVKGSSNLMRSIRLLEMLRFSHQIPAFRLTDERDGSLRGFWELDPAALPEKYFKVKS